MMKNMIVLGSLFVSIFSSAPSSADVDKVPYPDGYRGWAHVKSMVIKPGHALENPFQGIHHVYGNPKAIQGLNDGDYSEGATFVFDLLNYDEQGHSLQEADRKLIGVMRKDSKKYKNTGGWGFEGFAADSKTDRLVNDGGNGCYACHASVKDQGYVFSTYRE